MQRSSSQWLAMLLKLGVRSNTALVWCDALATAIGDNTFSAGEQDLFSFIGQALVETRMFEALEEDLNYIHPERLCAVWPRRFPTIAAATPYMRNPEALANLVYGGRMGNVRPGDGWLYRGSGIPQITGHDNYARMQAETGLPLLEKPELLREPLTALQVGIVWWEKNIPDADLNDPEKVTRDVQGGDEALARRIQLTDLVRKVWSESA